MFNNVDTWWFFQGNVMAAALMVMPRSRSWFMKSMTVSPSCTSPGLDMKPEMFNAWRKIEARECRSICCTLAIRGSPTPHPRTNLCTEIWASGRDPGLYCCRSHFNSQPNKFKLKKKNNAFPAKHLFISDIIWLKPNSKTITSQLWSVLSVLGPFLRWTVTLHHKNHYAFYHLFHIWGSKI